MDQKDSDGWLILGPSHELIAPLTARDPVLGEMVKSSLALAKHAAQRDADLDSLVREAKRIQRCEGMTPEDIHAFNLFYRAATAGHAEAQYRLSGCYALGNGVNKDIQSAVQWLEKAAEQHCIVVRQAPSALHILRLYWEHGLEGLDVPRYYGEFNNWYFKAMEQGEADVQFKIGECLNAGIVVPQDGDEAASWYHRAASQGHPDAQYRLGLYLKDHFEEQVVRALSNTIVRREFGSSYLSLPFDVLDAGTGETIIHANSNMTRPMLYKLVKDYEPRNIYPPQLSSKIEEIITDRKKAAATLFRRAAEQGHADSQRQLGICYKLGHCVEIDLIQAYAWFCLAADAATENAEEEKIAVAAQMSTSELAAGNRLYQEFKGEYSKKR